MLPQAELLNAIWKALIRLLAWKFIRGKKLTNEIFCKCDLEIDWNWPLCSNHPTNIDELSNLPRTQSEKHISAFKPPKYPKTLNKVSFECFVPVSEMVVRCLEFIREIIDYFINLWTKC